MTSITGNGEKERVLRKQLRKQARDLIGRGQLPAARTKGAWSGPGSGTRCALCGLKISFTQVEIEAEFPNPRGGSRLDKLHFHDGCLAEFELERDRLRAASRLTRNKTGGGPLALDEPLPRAEPT